MKTLTNCMKYVKFFTNLYSEPLFLLQKLVHQLAPNVPLKPESVSHEPNYYLLWILQDVGFL